jgi:hypothetical protein
MTAIVALVIRACVEEFSFVFNFHDDDVDGRA